MHIITDRGEAAYRRKQRLPGPAKDREHDSIVRKHDSIVRKHDSIVQDVKGWIYQALKPSVSFYTASGSKITTDFVPRSKFEEILSYDNIVEIVKPKYSDPGDTSANRQSILARVIYQGTDDRPPARKLLAVLIMLGIHKEIQNLIDDDMSDDCLPPLFQKGNNPEEFTSTSTCPVHTNGHPALDQLLLREGTWKLWDSSNHSKKKVEGIGLGLGFGSPLEFVEWSRRLTAPYIMWEWGKSSCHYVMRGGGALPMTPARVERDGGFGGVMKVRIDAGDRSFDSPQGSPDVFALIEIQATQSQSHFSDFLHSWIAGIDGGKANDIPGEYDTLVAKHGFVKLLATFEEPVQVDQFRRIFMLCPWADWNLETYRKVHNEKYSPLNIRYLKWTIRNFFHLAKALHYLQLGKRASTVNTTNNPGYYNSSPINPINILVFPGRGHIQGECDDSFQSTMALSQFRPPFAVYTAPSEVGLVQDVKETYSESDVFRFGCLLLEHLVWLFKGDDGLEKFSMARLEVDPSFVDGFWDPTSTERGHLKEIVKSIIAELRDRNDCVQAVADLLTFIEDHMLDMTPRSRMASSQILV
ncbi:hypothetical protein V8F06_011327, partial [Rhypophila decipiens]